MFLLSKQLEWHTHPYDNMKMKKKKTKFFFVLKKKCQHSDKALQNIGTTFLDKVICPQIFWGWWLYACISGRDDLGENTHLKMKSDAQIFLSKIVIVNVYSYRIWFVFVFYTGNGLKIHGAVSSSRVII